MRLGLLLLGPALALGACVSHGDEGMVVLNNTSVGMATACSLTGDPGQPFESQGTISVFSPGPYLVTPLIESRITADPTNPDQVLQRTIQLQGAHVHLSIPAGSTSVTTTAAMDFDALFSGDLPPQGTANVAFDLIPEQLISDVGALSGSSVHVEVVASVTVFGSLAGDRIDATPWQYPVTICNDCVVNPIGACGSVTATNKGNPCNPFQDGVVDCCTMGASLVCPAM
jgi:hypothetical protein